ncbi:MAG TPA: metal-sulfur cluster assembly factor [Trueperaceae bacterium]
MTTETVLFELDPAVPAVDVLEALKVVIDPELGVDVVNLGLVYEVRVEASSAHVELTLTTPGCPLHASIEAQVVGCLEAVPGIERGSVTLVWDPPWTPMSMTDEGKRQLGFF